MFSPLEQFEVLPIKGLFVGIEYFGLSVTNFTLFAVLVVIIILLLFVLNIFCSTIIPNSGQYLLESIYLFIYNIISSNLEFENHKYFPYIFTIFVLILISNLIGLLPYSYTLTSQIILTFFLALSSFIGLLYIGIRKHGINFLGIFFPPEAPLILAFLLVPIEMVSFFSRPFSLAIRLFANMTAGHVLLKILTSFVVVMFSFSIGYVPNIVNFFKILTVGFHQNGENFLPVTEFYSIKFAFYNNNYVSYDTDLLYCSTVHYYSHLFRIIDIIDSSGDGVEETPVWFQRVKWRHLFLVNYLAPIFGSFPTYTDSNYFFNHIAFILYNPPTRKIFAIFHNKQFFYMELPYSFSYIMYCYSLNIFSLIFPDVALININIQPFFYPLQLLFSLITFCVLTFAPLTIIIFFIILEVFVSLLQAYVFTILLVIYLRDVTELH